MKMLSVLSVMAAVLSLASVASAKTITIQVDDTVHGTANGNFDGSVAFNDPTLTFNGGESRVNGDRLSAIGICKVVGKYLVDYYVVSDSSVKTALKLDDAGSLSGYGAPENNYVLSVVICK